ncbi:MAG: hypothetical protein KBT36_15810 [Kurthia sp.]|nr:hypothetical protein [Candidatus Kurthia equi]
MFKKRKFKIRVSGYSGMLIIGLLVILIACLAVALPLFGFFGLSILLAKYHLSHIDIFSHWYQNALYFGWFLLLVLGIVFIIDLIGLFTIATINLEYSIGVNIFSTIIQFMLCLLIYHEILMNIFTRIDVTWLGSAITVALIYMITSTFTSTTIIDESTK